MTISRSDPRLERWAAFFGILDSWRAKPDAPDAPSANEIAILLSETIRETVGIVDDDPRIVQARHLLGLGDEFNAKYGKRGTFNSARMLIDYCIDWLQSVFCPLAVQHRFYASLLAVEDLDAPLHKLKPDEVTAAGAAALFRGESQFHEDVTVGILGLVGRLFKEDAQLQSLGDTSVIGLSVPERNRQNRLSTILDKSLKRSILRAHYDGARDSVSWPKAHERLIPNIPEDTRKRWNKQTNRELRDIASQAGYKVSRQLPLDEREKAMERHVLCYTPEQFRQEFAKTTRAGMKKSK
jgi:hypothetical protein